MTKKFFIELSKFYSSENDLSNVVVATCNASDVFREKFLKFFFPEINLDKILEIRREVSDKMNTGSRVDIYISMSDGVPYIIEIKKWDQNHHFGQYDEAFGVDKSHFGYITNYECEFGKQLGYDVKSWTQFYDYLLDASSDDPLTEGFISYLKNVCQIIKYYQPMNLTGLNSIPCFVDTVKEIISKKRSWVNTDWYRQYAYSSSIHEGFTFSFSENEKEIGFAAFGLWYQEKPIITIGISARSQLSEKILENAESLIPDLHFSATPYQEYFWHKDDVWFELKDEKLKELMNAASYEEQKQILEEFFMEVIKSLRPFFNPDKLK